MAEAANSGGTSSVHDAQEYKPLEKTVPGLTILIDNYDSFTFNIVQYLCRLGTEVHVYRNDKVTVEQLEAMGPTRLVLSPGPGHPSSDAGVCEAALKAFAGKIPILGVCMGMQVMYEAYGGTVEYAGEIKHGKSSAITHDGKGVFEGLPSPYKVVRYHSLAGNIATLPQDLEVSAQTDNGIIQAVRHKQAWMEGVQFHPESILTEHGMELLQNFCKQASGMREGASTTASG